MNFTIIIAINLQNLFLISIIVNLFVIYMILLHQFYNIDT
jgi:hypothetical protein